MLFDQSLAAAQVVDAFAFAANLRSVEGVADRHGAAAAAAAAGGDGAGDGAAGDGAAGDGAAGLAAEDERTVADLLVDQAGPLV